MQSLMILLIFGSAAAADGASQPRWTYVHRWLAEQRDQMSADLESAHAVLLERARTEGSDALVERLAEPPGPRPRGYAILPEIKKDAPLAPVALRRNIFSLETLGRDFSGRMRDAAVLADRLEAEPGLPLEPQVAEFERLRDGMRHLDDQLAYHANWQIEIVEHRAYFEERNRVIGQTRKMSELLEAGATGKEIDALRSEILEQVAPFAPTSGLRCREVGGRRVLPVDVHTDIEDEEFLATFAGAVADAWSQSDAARAQRFSVELSWKRVASETLYPEGPPATGEAIDMEAHVDRFPEQALVLTTGAASTHSWTGRSVLLGPSPLRRRELAHEFGHLLGFTDAYLRGFEGEPTGTFGVVVVEWVGLQDDLMGSPESGRVTETMIDRLIDAYGCR